MALAGNVNLVLSPNLFSLTVRQLSSKLFVLFGVIEYYGNNVLEEQQVCFLCLYIYIITITLNYLFEYCVQSYCPSPFDQITCLFR